MEVKIIPVLLYTAEYIYPRLVTLGIVNGIWTLCIAPKNEIAKRIEDITEYQWNNDGSLIHLSSYNCSTENRTGRASTILLAAHMPLQLWQKFKKQEPTCWSLIYSTKPRYDEE